jgi:hypothetical protein
MPRLHVVLVFGLSLVSCDKPVTVSAPEDVRKTARQESQSRRHTSHLTAPDSRAQQRDHLTSASNIKSPAAREKALAEIAWNTIETDPATAHKAFHQLATDSPEKLRLIRHYAMRAASRNPDEALDWAATLESEAEIRGAISHIALEIAASDPNRAANLISEFGLQGREFDVALVEVVQRWAANSPSDAVEWVTHFPPGAARQASVRSVLERWLPRDPQAALNWVNSKQDDTLRDEAIRGMMDVYNQQTPDARSLWIQHASPGILDAIGSQIPPDTTPP